ncbi:hypothetical protein DH86_00004266 [Scytalidium sp. 3C]|nr:hypothetical protein DH86_00004266 [Scytalidium sp. 3C]
MSVIATSVTDGSATLENLSSGEKVTQYFSDVTSASLCETTAEFIIEDYNTCDESGSNCQPVPFASFSPAVEFREISATANGESVPLNDVSIYEVTVNNQERTSCSLSGNTLTCSYV